MRVSYTKDDVTGLPVILEQNHYYPFGLKHTNYNTTVLKLRGSNLEPALINPNKYRHRSYEFQDELGLNWYDFEMRGYMPDIGRWGGVDMLAEKSRRFSPYAYCLNNPVYFIDVDGMYATDGIFVDESGKNIGNDGKDDNKVYVVKTTETEFDSGVAADGITKSERNATVDFIKSNSGNTSVFESNSIAYDNSVEIEGDSATRQAMVNIVNQDDGRGGVSPANNREYGGTISSNGVVTESPPGAVANPKTDNTASIKFNMNGDVKSTFHSHQSGQITEGVTKTSNTVMMNGTSTTYGFNKAPSTGAGYDVSPGKAPMTNYVFSRGEGKVYIYNTNTGVQATLPQKNFVKPR